MKKILSIIGARPQFIKAAAFSLKLKEFPISEDILHTGQHFDAKMSQIFFDELCIPKPKYLLNTGGGTHAEQTAKMLTGIEAALINEKYDLVLVYGDTNSTLAGALTASKLHIPVAHVEAGLRSFNKKMPEEINRILTDHCSDYLFSPTATAMDNLKNEGLAQRAHLVGDIMYDSILVFSKQIDHLATLPYQDYYLVTLHRAENVDSPNFINLVFEAFEKLSSRNFLIPSHPRLRNNIAKHGVRIPQNIRIIEPVSYFDMLKLQKNALAVLTDSGGIQKEAYFQKIPCLTLRTETEWVETVLSGWNQLANLNSPIELAEQIKSLAPPDGPYLTNMYGNGDTAKKIIDIII